MGSEQIGLVHVGLGEREAALALLEKSEEERNNWMVNIAIDRRSDPLRSDPRFVALLMRLNLPASPR